MNRNFEDINDFEEIDDLESQEFLEPENYGGYDEGDDDDIFQNMMKMKSIQKSIKKQPMSLGGWKEEKPYSPIKPSDMPLEKYIKMKKEKSIKESYIDRIVSKVLSEEHQLANYMFFSNLEQMKRQCEMLMELDPEMVDDILNSGHDWADDHVTEAKTNMDQVFDFMMNKVRKQKEYVDFEEMDEGIEITEKKKKNTPTNPQLWSKSLSWAKARYKVCPSAYCNGAAAKHYKSLGGKWKKK